MIGILQLPGFGCRNWWTVGGGPYLQRPACTIGVKVAKEIKAKADHWIDIKDFCTPTYGAVNAVLPRIVDDILAGKAVYFGCMGGRGRTGLVLAILAKAWGIEKPVEFVRETYYRHAVETDEQYEFVMKYRVDKKLARRIWWAKAKNLFRTGNVTTGVFDPDY